MEGLTSLQNSMKEKVQRGEEVCYACGGKGFLGRKCDVCGKIIEVKKEEVKIKTNYNNRIIPEFYLDYIWDSNIIRKENRNNIYLDSYLNKLDSILDNIKNGRKEKNSSIIVSPESFGKRIWAYTYMRYALDKGLTVAPILDTQEYKRLSVLGSSGSNYKLMNWLTIDDYIMSDVLIITVVKDERLVEAFAQILSLLDKRDRLGKPTIILSEFTIEQLSRHDYTNSFKNNISKGSVKPSFKRPKLIEYREE